MKIAHKAHFISKNALLLLKPIHTKPVDSVHLVKQSVVNQRILSVLHTWKSISLRSLLCSMSCAPSSGIPKIPEVHLLIPFRLSLLSSSALVSFRITTFRELRKRANASVNAAYPKEPSSGGESQDAACSSVIASFCP